MTRRVVVFAVLFSLAAMAAWADDLDRTDSYTIIIGNVGNSDHYISPLMISTTDAGIERGRIYYEKNWGIDFRGDTCVVTAAMMKKLIKAIRATPTDGVGVLKSFGVMLFTVLHSDSTSQSILLGRANAIALLKSLESLCQNGPLQKDLEDLRDQVNTYGHGPPGTD